MKSNRQLFHHYSQPENHITHIFLKVLENNPQLYNKLMKKLGLKTLSSKLKFYSQQAPLKNNKKDESVLDGMIINAEDNYSIGIENKVFYNQAHADQLNRHIGQLVNYPNPILWIITPDDVQVKEKRKIKPRGVKLIYSTWRNIIDEMVVAGPDKGELPKHLYTEFIQYLERCPNMTNFSGFHFDYGYDPDLAKLYAKEITKLLTPTIKKLYPGCTKTRGAIMTSAWDAWYSGKQVQSGVHPGYAVKEEGVHCSIVLANGCRKQWKSFADVLDDEKKLKKFLDMLRKISSKLDDNSYFEIGFKQRHYKSQSSAPDIDGTAKISVDTLLGTNKAKLNLLWLDLLKELAKKKSKYNLQAQISIRNDYVDYKDLMTSKALKMMEKNFKLLVPVYKFLG